MVAVVIVVVVVVVVEIVARQSGGMTYLTGPMLEIKTLTVSPKIIILIGWVAPVTMAARVPTNIISISTGPA